jgi:hypothetical protein
MNNLHTRSNRLAVKGLTVKGLESPLFLVGKDSHGNWVARDQSGLCGGLFVGRDEALKFAKAENGNRPQAIVVVDDVLELDMSVTPRRPSRNLIGAVSVAQQAKPAGRRPRRKAAA